MRECNGHKLTVNPTWGKRIQSFAKLKLNSIKNHKLQVHSPKNFNDAYSTCKAKNMELAHLKSLDEQITLSNMIENKTVWIGIKAAKDIWYKVHSKEIVYSKNYDSQHPIFSKTSQKIFSPRRQCVAMYNKDGAINFIARNCIDMLPFICMNTHEELKSTINNASMLGHPNIEE